MKTIDTLVADIYSLFESSVPDMSDDEVDNIIDKFGDALKVHLKRFIYEEERRRDTLRLSAIGKPERQQWYSASPHSKVKENIELQGKDKIKFLYGYILEELLLTLSSLAGHEVKDEQKEVSIEGVLGHQDAVIDNVLVDCKSSSGRGFDKFKNNYVSSDDPFGYIAQISAYAQANGLKDAAFLAIDKSTGEIVLTPVHSMEFINAEARIKHLKGLVSSNAIPNRCYDPIPDGKSGNFKLPVGCVFCSHKRECWADANSGRGIRVFKYAQGKRYLVQIGKEPDVPEVIDW